jgi:hypothetical protein
VRIEPPRPPGHPIDEVARLRLQLALVVAETAVDPVAAWHELDLWPDGAALVERAEREVLAATDRRARRPPATTIGTGAFLPGGTTETVDGQIAEARARYAADVAEGRAIEALPVVAPVLDEIVAARADLADAATVLRSRFDPACWEWTMTMLAFNGEAWVPPGPPDGRGLGDATLVDLARLTRLLPRWRSPRPPAPPRTYTSGPEARRTPPPVGQHEEPTPIALGCWLVSSVRDGFPPGWRHRVVGPDGELLVDGGVAGFLDAERVARSVLARATP